MLCCVTGIWLPTFRNHYAVPKRREPNIQWPSVTSQKNWCPFYRSARNVLSTKNSKSEPSSKTTALLRVLHDRETWFKMTNAWEELRMSAAKNRRKEHNGSNRRIQKLFMMRKFRSSTLYQTLLGILKKYEDRGMYYGRRVSESINNSWKIWTE